MARAGFSEIPQRDFSAGMFRGIARHLIPPTGVYNALNGLFDEDGNFYRRGGSEYKSDAGLGTTGLRWVWDGALSPGARTLVARSTTFGVLDSNDTTILDLGAGAGATGLATPTRAVKVGGLLFIGGGTIYGGSRKTANYSTGTVTTTTGSRVVTGAGTTWSTNVDAGMLFRRSGERVYVVESVDSNTQITLTEQYQGTGGAGQAYTLKQLELATAPYKTAEIYATLFDRLIPASGNRLDPSASDDAAGLTRPHTYDATDFQVFPTDILGAEGLRDTLLVFCADGVYAMSGLGFDQTDAAGNIQWRSELVNRDRILWGKEGVATFGNHLVVPCVDGVWTMGVAAGPQLLSRSINGLYASYVRAGHHPGLAAVYGAHYVLPILDSSNAVIDMLVCRLDRPIETPLGICFPWAHWDGHGGNVAALAVRVGGASAARQPSLLAASRATGSRLLKLNAAFAPDAAHKSDADATTHVWEVETRDHETGPPGSTTRRLRITYELIDAGTDDPKISGWYSKGSEIAGIPKYGTGLIYGSGFTYFDSGLAEFTALTGQAPEDTGRTPYTWSLAAGSRYIRARLRCSDPCASLKLRTLEWFVMASGRQ